MKHFDLSGTWTGEAVNRNIKFPCPIPGDIASALIADRTLSDPYCAMQELKIQYRAGGLDSEQSVPFFKNRSP